MSPKKQLLGLSLIELSVVLVMIGIIAVVAVPAYNNFRIKSRVSNVISFYRNCLTDVANFYQSSGQWPETACGMKSFNSGGLSSYTTGLPDNVESTHYNFLGNSAWINIYLDPITTGLPDANANAVTFLITPTDGNVNSSASLAIYCGWWWPDQRDYIDIALLPSSCHQKNIVDQVSS